MTVDGMRIHFFPKMILLDWTLGQRAICAFRKSLRLYAKRVIEPRPVVLPCDGRGQLYHLRLIEIFSQPSEQLIRHFNWRPGHPNSVVDDELLRYRFTRDSRPWRPL